MSDTFNYSLLKRDDGNYVLRSSITSFGLNQITDKDIVSFYRHFSAMSHFDTGLMPLDGTGVLSIRSTGPHMQISVQHAPGCYHINWGATESDRNANTYYLAQPYRIVVGDFINGTLLGAKMFYSPYPITHSNQPLYHVNLPNINCRGYRGNAVGWICLYLKEDWSALPFNEKITRLIERCSGVETYNDANMSETDGPRFYEQKYRTSNKDYTAYDYLWRPDKWQSKTASEGFQWTLGDGLWIPILVKDMDHQSRHQDDGVPLTFAMAVLGNYQAYYTDRNIPKLYNLAAREDLSLTNEQIADMVKSSFALAPSLYSFVGKDNPYTFSVEHREKKATTKSQSALFEQEEEQEEEEETWTCDHCSEIFGNDHSATFDYIGNAICHNCLSDHYVYLETPGSYFPVESEYVYYAPNIEAHLHTELDNCVTCENCDTHWGAYGHEPVPVYKVSSDIAFKHDLDEFTHICDSCLPEFAQEHGYEEYIQKCFCGKNNVINLDQFKDIFPRKAYLYPVLNSDGTVNHKAKVDVYCAQCSHKAAETYTCPCGLLKSHFNDTMMNCGKVNKIEVGEFVVSVHSACNSCVTNLHEENGSMVGDFVPFNQDLFKNMINKLGINEKQSIVGATVHLDVNKVVF